jgi:hypothetical protein
MICNWLIVIKIKDYQHIFLLNDFLIVNVQDFDILQYHPEVYVHHSI